MRIYGFKLVLIIVAAVFLIGFGGRAGAESPSQDKEKAVEGNDYVAVVNGVKIPARDLERKVNLIKARYGGSGAQIGGQQLARVRQSVLNSLIEQQLLYQASKDEGIQVDSAEIKKQMDQVKGQFKNEEDFRKQIAQMNYSEDVLKKEIKQNLAIRKLIDKKFASDVSVTDQEIRSYYENNEKQYQAPEKVHARHILIKSGQDANDAEKKKAREKIEKVQKKLENGEDFSKLAKEYSEGPSAKSGGDLGYFSQGQMVKNFEEAAFAMEPGEVSDIVNTRFGYHLIKVEDKQEKGVQSFKEVKDSIRQKLERKKMQQKLEPYLESLKQKYPVEKSLPGATDQG